MKIKAWIFAFCISALVASAAEAWGPPRPGFYFGFYGPPVYGPPVYGPPIYGPPVYPGPRVVVAPPPVYLAPPPPVVYPRPAPGFSVWFR